MTLAASLAVAFAPAAHAATFAPGDKMVVLGDSFSAGLAANFIAQEGRKGAEDPNLPLLRGAAGCDHSPQNYGGLLAAKYGLQVVDASCSGVTIAQARSGGQLNSVTPDTKLVVMTIGGNDTLGPVVPAVCASTAFDCSFFPVRMFVNAVYDNYVFPKLRKDLAAFLNDVGALAPGAQIRIAGYPYLFPTPGDVKTTTVRGRTVNVADNCPNLSGGERAMMASMQDRLNATIAAAVRDSKIGAERVRYVDPTAATSPFRSSIELRLGSCSTSKDRWIMGTIDGRAIASSSVFGFTSTDPIVNWLYATVGGAIGLNAFIDISNNPSGGYHPDKTGHELYAKLIAQTLS